MSYLLENRLVIGVASSAVFDLTESDAVFREAGGERAYRRYQEEHLNTPLEKGNAFSFIKRLLSLNDLSPNSNDPLVEVILLSQNDPDTGLRVMNSIKYHGLQITRAIFSQGRCPYEYIPALNISLFLSGSAANIKSAILAGHPAGHVMDSAIVDDEGDRTLRIAFDFDAVVADDESERVYKEKNLEGFYNHEVANAVQPHNPGPLKEFLVRVSKIQEIEESRKETDPSYQSRLRISIVTARSAPAHERALHTLKSWNVIVNDAFFLGGIEKGQVIKILRPHIFFDDQTLHLNSTAQVAPSVHIPFGVRNEDSSPSVTAATDGITQIEEVAPLSTKPEASLPVTNKIGG